MEAGSESEGVLVMVREAFARGCIVRFRSRGDSMAPTIADGAVVAVAPVEGGAVRAGDVVLCLVNGANLALRRIRGLGRDATVLVRGDAPASEPDRLERDAVLGKAIGVFEDEHIRRLGGRYARLRVVARRTAHLLVRGVTGAPRP